ncbi:MAG: hypothetical protein QXS62_05620 [Sulfolobales archaeon]
MKGREPREVSPETLKMWSARGSLERPKGKADPRPMRGEGGEAMTLTYVNSYRN